MRKKILVLDDDAQVRASLRKALHAEGYDVVVAADGEAGLEQYHRDAIDLLLLDLKLPDKSGWDAFEQLTLLRPLVPVVIITGRRDQRELAAAAGAGAIFEKPLNVSALLEAIHRLLREPPETHLQRLAGVPE